MNRIKSVLTNLRLLNSEGQLSITNILVYTLIASSFYFSINPVFGTIVIVLYGFGRFLNFKRGQVVEGAIKTLLSNQKIQQQEINQIKDKITGISVKAGITGSASELKTSLRRF